MDWREFWNRDTPIYVSERHRRLHYETLAAESAALVPSPDATVLDHGCGEALFADRIADACGRLLLCDGAPLVRERLAARLGTSARIAVLAPEEVDSLPDGSVDLVVANSLAQYLSRDELAALLALWRRKLAKGGRLVLADIVSPRTGAATDALALLQFAARGGFLGAALAGLVRTALSDYRRLRGTLGLSRYPEEEMLSLLAAAGYAARRAHPNLGHNQSRMTFVATPQEERITP